MREQSSEEVEERENKEQSAAEGCEPTNISANMDDLALKKNISL